MKNLIVTSILMLLCFVSQAEDVLPTPFSDVKFNSKVELQINKVDVSDLKIAFNSSNQSLEISAPATTGVFEFRVYSILGKVVMKNDLKFYKEKTSISTEQLIDGVYILSMQSKEGKSRSFKFIK